MFLNCKLGVFFQYCLILLIGYIANIAQALWSMWEFRNNQSAASLDTSFTKDLFFGYGILYLTITGITLFAITKLRINKSTAHSIFIIVKMNVYFGVDLLIFQDRNGFWGTYDIYSTIARTFYLSAIPIIVCTGATIWPEQLSLKKNRGIKI